MSRLRVAGWRLIALALGSLIFARTAATQDLTPRAYIITPVHSNAIVLSYSFENGNILINPTLPISNSRGTLHIAIASYSHSFNLFGQTSGVGAILPFGIGHFTPRSTARRTECTDRDSTIRNFDSW